MPQNDRGNQGRSEEDADDVRLMQLVGRGDTQAFEQLIEKHQTLVAGTVARMLGSSSDVEDIAQQVFIRVWKSARRYVPRAKFTTWLLKITRNLVFNEMRRTKRRPHVPLQSEPGAEDLSLKDETNLAPDASLLSRNYSRRSRKRFSGSRKPSGWRSRYAGINSSATNKSPKSSISRSRR